MRMILPPLRDRHSVDRQLETFFRAYREFDFRRGIAQLTRYYHLPAPTVVWFEYLDWGKTAGRTYEDGRIHLVHPENWKRGRKYNSVRRWINTVYHEMGHYIFWADAERKADTFAHRMVRGLGNARLLSGALPAHRLPSSIPVRTNDRVGANAVALRRPGPARARMRPSVRRRAART